MENPFDFVVTVDDIRAANGCCNPFAVRGFYRRHNLDFKALLSSGTPALDLIKTGDAMALKIVEVARGRK